MTLTDYITRRTSTPAPAPVQVDAPGVAPEDAHILEAWGLTPWQWAALDAPARMWHRWNVTKAPYFTA